MSAGEERRLAAIMMADVVGYSGLMEADEAGTIRTLKAHRRDHVDPAIAANGGRIVKTTGDGMLLEFASAVAAVGCALGVQKAMATTTDGMRFRIGINLGDVVVDGEDILGEGVNIAARLEALAEPGGIAVSGTVHDQVRGKLDAVFSDDGEHEVKNIRRPVRVWRWAPETTARSMPAVAPRDEIPSIAVLPFANRSSDPEQEFFCDGIAEDVITALSMVSRLKVIARNSSFAYKGDATDLGRVATELGVRYVLEGSVRSGGSRIRVTAQLIDAADGTHLWAERYDRRMDDVFEIQDEIVKEIVTNLRLRLTDGERALMLSRGTNNVEAWRNCVTAWDLWLKFDAAAASKARELARRAIDIDPDYATAWALVGWTVMYEGRLSLGPEAMAHFEEADTYARKALVLNESEPAAISLNAMLAAALNRHADGVEIARRGLTLHPGNADTRAIYGFTLMHAGRYDEAVQHFEAAIDLNPLTPSWYHYGHARVLLCLERHVECLAATERLLKHGLGFQMTWIYRAHALECLGRHDEARAAMTELQRFAPMFRRSHLPQFFMHDDPGLLAHVDDVLGRLGLPA